MKKIQYFVISFFLYVILMPVVFASENIEIQSIELDSKSINTVINAEPTFNGLEMNFDLSFKTLGDSAKYKVVIKNNTDTDYKISDDSSFNQSDYVSYTYEVSDELKAKDEAIVYVTITYNKEVDSSLMIDNKYVETNKAIVQLLDNDGEIVEEQDILENPKTGGFISMLIIMGLLVVFGILLVVFKRKDVKYMSVIFMIGISIIPVITYAVETIQLTIHVNVEIEQGYEVDYLIDEVFVKESDRDKYDLSYAECNDVLYVGEKTDDNKYTYCRNVILKDDKLYSYGETVELKVLKRTVLEVYDQDENFYCTVESEGVYICDSSVSVLNLNISSWSYNGEFMRGIGYTILDNDIEMMNFNSIDYGNWNRDKYIVISAPQTFIMPNHNILFGEPYSTSSR